MKKRIAKLLRHWAYLLDKPPVRRRASRKATEPGFVLVREPSEEFRFTERAE